MVERRESVRDKVIYGGVAKIGENGSATDCVVRNISDKGANLEFRGVVPLLKKDIGLTIARKGRSFLAKVIWWRDNFVGVAFSFDDEAQVSDIEQRLRQSEKKKRQLQRRIKELLDED
jgi:PilZ domain